MEETQATVTAVRLDRETIVDAAERILAAEGTPALTMRRIGEELGADPTALYRHFRNKDALLRCLAERVFATAPEIDSALPWQEKLRIDIRHSFHRYHGHPDLGILLARQPDDIPPLVQIVERMLTLLVEEAGLDLETAATITHQIECHVVGAGLFFAISDHRNPDASGTVMRRAYALLPADQYPYSAEAAPFLFPEPEETFERTTDLLITAIERLGHAQGAGRTDEGHVR